MRTTYAPWKMLFVKHNAKKLTKFYDQDLIGFIMRENYDTQVCGCYKLTVNK